MTNKNKATKGKAAVKRPKTAAKVATGVRAKAAPPHSGRQVQQGYFQPDRRKGMPPLRRDDVEGARCVHGEARDFATISRRLL